MDAAGDVLRRDHVWWVQEVSFPPSEEVKGEKWAAVVWPWGNGTILFPNQLLADTIFDSLAEKQGNLDQATHFIFIFPWSPQEVLEILAEAVSKTMLLITPQGFPIPIG